MFNIYLSLFYSQQQVDMTKRILILTIFSFLSLFLFAQKTNQGKEFWLSFYGWEEADTVKIRPPHYLDLYVLVSSKTGCTGSVKNPITGYVQNFTVQADSVLKVYIPYEQSYCNSIGDTVNVYPRGIQVTTSDTVALYLGNQRAHTFDASLVLPTSALGYSYKVANYLDNASSCFIAVATEDSTLMEFNLQNDIDDENGSQIKYLKNTNYTKWLMKGETFMATGANLLGSTVKSLNCRKLAVFAGNYCPYVPDTCGYCDVLVEQIPPINTWGKKYLVNSTFNTRPIDPNTNEEIDSKIIIISKEDNTTVNITKNWSVNTHIINKDDYLELDASKYGVLIEGDKAIAVTQYAIGRECSGLGDPFMLWINPAEQTLKEAIFTACPTPQINYHLVQIKTLASNVNDVYLDGTNIGHLFYPFFQDKNYAVAIFLVEPTVHKITSEKGFMAYMYGFADGVTQIDESYGYTLGSSLYNLEDYFNVMDTTGTLNPIYFDTEPNTNTYNVDDSITISRNLESEYTSVSWLVNQQIYPIANDTNQKNFSWKLAASNLHDGENTISMLVNRSCITDTISGKVWLRSTSLSIQAPSTSLCLGDSTTIKANASFNADSYVWQSSADTIITSSDSLKVKPTSSTIYTVYAKFGNYQSAKDSILIQVNQPSYITINDSICPKGSYIFEGDTLKSAGTYYKMYKTVAGCDSLYTLHLVNRKPITKAINRPLCPSTGFQFGTQTITAEGIYYETFLTTKGCDSLVTLQVVATRADTTYLEKTIEAGESYFFNEINLIESGIYKDSLINSNGCDSIVILNLNVKEAVNDIIIPEGFSPNGDGINDFFVIENLENYPNNHIWIFNRWGNKMFESNPYLNDWDGKAPIGELNTGQAPPNGTYYYILDLGDGSKARKGWVWLER